MTKFVAVIAMLVTTSALAESPYPTPTRDGRERIQRTGTCPTGYVGKGDKCEALAVFNVSIATSYTSPICKLP